MTTVSSPLHLWIPNIFEFKGGIQVYSEFLLSALAQIFPDQSIQVFLKHDRQAKNTQPNISFHCSGHWPPALRTPAFASAIALAAIKNKPRLILSTHLNFTPASLRLKQLFNIPYWTVAHGVDAWGIQKSVLQQALHQADLILAVSHYTRDRLLKEQSLDPSKVVVLPNTFDETRFTIQPKSQKLLQHYQLKPDQPIILTVSRLDIVEQYKGYDKIIHALPKIIQALPNVHYLIVGKGSDRPRIETLIQHLQLENHVTLAGFIPDEALGDYYSLCDVFAMPSKGEGFGIVYLEALACGKPTLGGNQDGAIDALAGGKLGVLVDPESVDDIAQALIRILNGSSAHPLIYNPQQLREETIQLFGFQQFQQTLQSLCQTHFGSKP
ncbi:glycosyltransferase [Lyngbya confervoides]|uniref:Glycosyltransferase n=1 Tax=Lyngbya confervoides BDU141951 TaxID=1574623 RepID=A0ABD4T776_9CYAN|nr:glycosyltransferase [Lyngbya confervoides]MCM1984602.1 glycosyltransferase [Lyngbya confervoides BDU141951]